MVRKVVLVKIRRSQRRDRTWSGRTHRCVTGRTAVMSLSPAKAEKAMDGIRNQLAEDYSNGRVIDMMNEAAEELEQVAA